jgi:predicted outer membrane repeat protein
MLEALEERTLLSNYYAASVSDLIADINAANGADGTNNITLTAPTTASYTLTAVNSTTDGANGLPVIRNRDHLTIIGNGDTIERSAASGTSAFRLFAVASDSSLTLVNLTLQNGFAFGSGAAADGGAVYNQGTLVLNGVTVQDNTARGADGATVGPKKSPPPGADGAGGAIWSKGSLTLQNGTTLQNNAAQGGAGGTNLLYPGTQGNGGNAFGGALYLAGGSASISGTNISGSSASGGRGGAIGKSNGGGIYNASRATATITNNTTLSGNRADDSGGGIYNAGTVTVSGSTLSSNHADATSEYWEDSEGGGGIFNSGSLTVNNNSTLSNNYIGPPPDGFAGGSGGGILNTTTGTAKLDGSTLSGNTSVFDGGGIANTGSLTVNNCLLSGNSANNQYAPGGGAINNGGTLQMTDSILSNNTAYAGGAIDMNVWGTATLSGCTLSGNSAYSAGAIDSAGSLSITNSTLTNNSAIQNGGAIYSNGSLTITGSAITGNTAGSEGGGIFNYNPGGSSVVYLSNSTLGDNTPDNIFGDYIDQGGNTFY